MRVKNSLRNISMSLLSQIVVILLGFLSRKVFLDSLGSEYLGVNGLLTNVLSAMVMIEGGIGISIVYNLYKPLAYDDKEKIIALVQLYKNAYRILALIMVIISCAMYPFLDKIIKGGSNVKGIGVVYFLFVAKNVLNYLYGYKWALINADQRGYNLTKNNMVFQVISMIFKIIILALTKNYIAYLLIEFILFIMQNMYNSRVVYKLYPYIKTKEKYHIEEGVKSNIIENVKAMFIQNIGSYAINSTDNIIISTFINVSVVGLYSNYTMIIEQLSSLVSTIIYGISNSVGNLIATSEKDKIYFVFKLSYFISFWIYSVSFIFLFNLVEPFIALWIGDKYIFSNLTLFIILINFYIMGMRNSVTIFKSKSGLFSQDKYAEVIQGVINLIVSIILVKKIELIGVILGTTISYISISFWNQPRILYKYVFEKSVIEYFKQYITYVVIGSIACIISTEICDLLVFESSIIYLIQKGLICIIIPSIMYICIFYRTEEFKYLYSIVQNIVRSIRKLSKLNNYKNKSTVDLNK